jgi:FAD/FMN-containing dehydrogenase
MSHGVDRRAFLIGAAGLAVSACGGGGKSAGVSGARVSSTGTARPAVRAAGPITLRRAIRGPVVERGEAGFAAWARVYNKRFDSVRPHAVARPLDGRDVRDAIRWAVGQGVRVRARSGGHSYAGYSTASDGVVLDLRKLAYVHVDKRAGTAAIGSGTQLIDVYSKLAAAGATIPAGSCPSVGIGGHALGGGMGLAGRAFGLASDQIVGATIATADGRLRKAGHDLLWALRGGGGGNFGVVTELVVRLHAMPSTAAHFRVSWPWSSADEAIAAWQAWAPHSIDELTSILHLESGRSIYANGQYLGPAAALPGLLASLLAVPGAQLTSYGDLPYLALQRYWAGCSAETFAECHTIGTSPGGVLPRTSMNAKSDYVNTPLSSAGRAAMVAAAESSAGSGALLCDCYGGAINRVAPGATAFVHRQQLFCIQYYGNGSSAAWVDQAWRKLRAHVSGMAYQNYIDPALSGWHHAYYGANYARLLATRNRVDPHGYFTFPQAIGRK